ncbi:hypothetical protein SEA_POUND_14 [Mycobacterium phage Pound]|nr:hypothetical protein SEA_POUND_14 [Mycobacterium phage Pound]
MAFVKLPSGTLVNLGTIDYIVVQDGGLSFRKGSSEVVSHAYGSTAAAQAARDAIVNFLGGDGVLAV